MLTKEKALEVLKIDNKLKEAPIQLFKKNTLLMYIGRCRKVKGGLVVTTKDEVWVGKKDIFERQFGYVVDFVLSDKELHILPKTGDVIYLDPYCGELVPFELDEELLYFKVVKLDEINLIIK